MRKYFSKLAMAATLVGAALPLASAADKNKIADPPAKSAKAGTIWVDPTDLESRNLIFGNGGKKHQPTGTEFTFVDEDMDGTNPKWNVTDADGVKWKIKVGAEARPETAATRFVWAVGYYANEDYFLPEVHVSGLPAHVRRGQNYILPGGKIQNVRLKRHLKHEENLGSWKWHDDPFVHQREWNGLRVMMALMNNWDLKDENNKVIEEESEKIYMVSDLGASFGTTGYNPIHSISKGNLASYRHSKFITKTTSEYVDFGEPSRPAMGVIFNIPEFHRRMELRWLGKRIPRQDARWMGQTLARLSPQQIRDAFRAAGYDPDMVEGFSKVVETRIAALRAL